MKQSSIGNLDNKECIIMKKFTILLVLISIIFSSCSLKKNDTQEMLKIPKEYKSINEFKSYMKELKGKSDEELYKQSEGISLKQYKSDFFFEPQKIPQDAAFQKIITRDVYVALYYYINNNVSELIPDDEEKNINMPLANEYATTVLYEWRCGSNEEGLKNFITNNTDNLKIKEINIDGVQVYYYESTIEHAKVSQDSASVDVEPKPENNIAIRRDYEYIIDDNWIHVALPYSIPLEDAGKYIFVKKTFFTD